MQLKLSIVIFVVKEEKALWYQSSGHESSNDEFEIFYTLHVIENAHIRCCPHQKCLNI